MMISYNPLKHSHIAKAFALLLAVCYLLSPMQQTLKSFAHDVSHAISKVQKEQHTHNDLMSSAMGRRVIGHHHHKNTHQHSVLSFFDTLFDSDKSSHQNQSTVDINFDKHFVDEENIYFKRFSVLQKHQFYFYDVLRKGLYTLETPPPEVLS